MDSEVVAMDVQTSKQEACGTYTLRDHPESITSERREAVHGRHCPGWRRNDNERRVLSRRLATSQSKNLKWRDPIKALCDGKDSV